MPLVRQFFLASATALSTSSRPITAAACPSRQPDGNRAGAAVQIHHGFGSPFKSA